MRRNDKSEESIFMPLVREPVNFAKKRNRGAQGGVGLGRAEVAKKTVDSLS